ncbi:hypothetical protein [Micromonospora sp. I033]
MRTGMLKRLGLAVGFAGVGIAGSVIAAAPASAGPYCDPGNHCVFVAGLGSAKHSYFNSDSNFTDDYFSGTSVVVNDNVWSASNSSTGGYESHYYYDIGNGGGLVFCVNPGSSVNASQLSDDGINGNWVGQRDEASSLLLRPATPIRCF